MLVFAAVEEIPLGEEELRDRLGWFIRVRWLFLAGLAPAIFTGVYVLRVDFPAARTIAVGLGVLGYNALFFLHHRLLRKWTAPYLNTSRIEAGLQIALDLLATTCLIHLVGGAETPFIFFYLFHAIVGSMLLSRLEAWLVGTAAFCLFLGVVVLEGLQVLPHYHPTALFGTSDPSGSYVFVVSVAFLITLLSTIWITTSVVSSLRARQQELVVAKQALIEKSEDLQQAYEAVTEQQRQLVETEKQASLGQLVAGIAHEINNPIQFIRGNLKVLEEALSDVLPLLDAVADSCPGLRIARLEYPFFRQHVPVLLGDMADGAARIGAIVRDLRTFARRDEGQLDEEVDLNAAIEASVRLLHNQLKHYHVEEDLDRGLPRIRGNMTQLQQVVMNTLQNASQALAGAHRGAIRIRTRADDGCDCVRLSIEDNGPGMAREVKERIFDPFFTTKQRSGGTGLGLAITYGIIQRHRGEIEVETEVGRGTTFHYLLRVDQGAA